MHKHKSLLSTTQSEELYSQLSELLKCDISLTERLFRCRQILENLYKSLTSNTNITFTGLYARMQYIHEVNPLPSSNIEQLQLLRLLTNKVVHKDDFEFGEADFISSVKVLAEAINVFTDKKIPAEIEKFITDKKAKNLVSFRTHVEAKVDKIYGTVTSWKTSAPKSSNNFIEIHCQIPDGSEVTITLWEKKEDQNWGRRWTMLDKALWKYCNIVFYNLSAVQGVINSYQSTPHTLVVLEQDFLLDVSVVADCFQNKDYYPELFLINKFFSEPITPALAKGKCANYIFDELVNDPQKDLKIIFNDYLQENPLSVCSIGEKVWKDIYRQIEQDHYPQLRQVAADLQNKNCQLEPSFIALKYGLHGRLDVIVLPDSELQKYSIIELKSGSAPSQNVWRAHQMQVIAYNLILKEVFGPSKIANSSIFYSRSIMAPLRHIVNHITDEQDFLMCRNRIMGIMQKLATEPEVIINWLKSGIRDYKNNFLTDKALHIHRTLNNLSEFELNWLTRKLKFIFREIWAAKTGSFVESEVASFGFSSLWNCSTVEKKNQYRLIDGLWVESINKDIVSFHRQDDSSISNFRTGDIVVLYKQEYPLTEQQLIRGTINLIENDKIVIRTRSIIRQEGVFDHYTLWAIEPDLIESSLYTGISSVYSLLCSDKSVRDKLMGFIQPEIEDIKFANVLSWRNDIAESLKGMIAAKDYYMVQGPPGTGKTSCLLIQYLTHLIHETSCKALVISFTNRAVDEICNYLENENISYLRLGSQQKITNNGKDKKKHQHLNKDALNLTILNYESERLFVSTVHSLLAVAPDFLRKINIDELIVDEASQILEHHIIGLVSKIKKTILVGDQNQLPPIILQQTKNEKESILEKFIVNADRNLFQNCYSMLTDHYRMHDDIARLVSYNYKNKLIPAEKRQTSKQPWLVTENKFLKNIMKSRLVWIDARPSLISKADTMHADWIKDFLDALSADIPIEEVVKKVGVIAPFRAQAQCIISKFGNKYKDLTVDTIERYQGSQRDCIIMSYPIRYQYELNLLQSVNMLGTIDRKLNVAISRAREQLIIIGNSRILAHSEFYHKVFNLIKENGLVISLKQ